ncbi:MAG: hypothetical protein CMJ39_03475 [Phycisphaerae bacterium]|nr:hypothetical protein [Phycisphaerae bacterium]
MQSKPYCPLMALMAMLCFTAATVAAPLEFCSCANEYQDGDVVHLLVDNPNGAPNLPAGSEGKILCGNNRFNGWVQVGFFGWNNGNRNLNQWCDCGGGDADSKGWWVKCTDLAPGWVSVPGACCLGQECIMANEEVCHDQNGEFIGEGMPCKVDTCSCGDPVECPDLDGNGVIDIDDAIEFLFQYFGHRVAPAQDLNADCEIDIQDLIWIIDAMTNCPLAEPDMPEPPQEPAITGACCTGDHCDVVAEADCEGDWVGEETSCDEVDCVVRAFSDEPLCQCDGQFRAGDKVTLLIDNPRRAGAVLEGRRPPLLRGARGVVLCADSSGWDRVAVAWEGFMDVDDPDARPQRDATWLCDCGVYRQTGMHELGIHRLETWNVDCENLLPGWRELDEVGACCLGDQCQPLPEADCADRGGSWGGDRSPCNAQTCAGEVLCHCDDQFAVGDRVRLLINSPLGDDDLDRNDHGHVICSWEHEQLGPLLLVSWWHAQGGAAHPALIDNCQCGWRDPSQPFNLQFVQCHHVELWPE